jgi:hypothetical protein
MDRMQFPSQEREFAQQHFLPDRHPSAKLLKPMRAARFALDRLCAHE